MSRMLTKVSCSSNRNRTTHSRISPASTLLFRILPKLRDIYVDRVDALMKILHLPTFWTALTNGLQHPHDLAKSLEAVMFAFCLATISTLKEGECQNLFGVPKSVVYSRYRLATRQALVNAGFLSTSSPMTLQAYAMFMVSYSYQAPFHC